MARKIMIGITLLSVLIVGACSILKKEDPEKDVRDFLVTFQQNLSKSDEEILKHFDASQSKQSILTALSLLKNTAHKNILCEVGFANAYITREGDQFRVDMMATFSSRNLDTDYKEESTLSFWIKPQDKAFVISKLDGEKFYQTFATMKNEMQWSVERSNAILERDTIYSMARQLEQKFDSVIWYSDYDGHKFFYVVEGEWVNYFRHYEGKPTLEYKMGLIDVHGEIVIPVEYQLIGTIGFDLPLITEVKKDGKVGYFNVKTRELVVPAIHDILVPYDKNEIFCIAKTDTVYGWYNSAFEYKDGFPTPEIEKWVKNFEFIPQHLQLDEANYNFCEIPARDHAGYGIVMPPSYLVKTGIFPEVEGGISTTEVPLNGWTDYVETDGTIFQSVTESISALVTTITERYIDGREEFYTHNKLIFVGPRQDTLSVTDLSSNGAIAIKRIGSDLLEVKYERPEDYYFYEEGLDELMPSYSYFKLTSALEVESLRTERFYSQVAFVKLDSSYMKGSFKHYDREAEQLVPNDFLTQETIINMRDEILAVYGYVFDDPETTKYFKQFSWYRPDYISREEFADQMTEIDHHNLLFLESLIIAGGESQSI